MFGKHTLQQVSDNQKYTQECDKIYHSFQIAEVKRTYVKEAAIPMFSSIFLALMIMAFIVCVVRIKVYGDMGGDNGLILSIYSNCGFCTFCGGMDWFFIECTT